MPRMQFKPWYASSVDLTARLGEGEVAIRSEDGAFVRRPSGQPAAALQVLNTELPTLKTTGNATIGGTLSVAGSITAPTATAGTNTTQVATTAFVQDAVGGYLSKTVTGGTVTLTDEEASNPVLTFKGTPTSDVDVILPATVKRLWAVFNATSGAFKLTVKTENGTGVTVAPGKRNLVYVDGTNVLDGFTDFESIALTGVPTSPTATAGTNTTQIATTAFVQDAVGGYLVKTVTGGTVTLTDAEASNPVIAFIGSLTADAVVIVSTTIKRLWAIHNATSGAFKLTIKTADGVGVDVAQGKRNLVYVTGTGVVDAFTDFESIAMTGTPTSPTAPAGTKTTQIATTSFVQDAVSGYMLKTVTGGTATLTDAEVSNSVLAFKGALTSDVEVILPVTVNRLWAVFNATSGAFNLTVRTENGVGVAVAQGKRNLVYTDGTNVLDAFNDFESIALSGTPTAPTAAAGTNTTQIATTAFVQATVGAATMGTVSGTFSSLSTTGDTTIGGSLSVTGNLTINGTTTTVNSTTVAVDDPIITLGGNTAPTADDNKDRGVEFRWHNGTAAKLGFFGFDDSTGKFTFIPDATNTSEVFSGAAGTIVANLEGSVTGNASTATKLAAARTISISGDVTYTSAAFDGSANVTGTATLAASGVTAGTYRSVTVDAKGRVTAGTNPTTLAGYGITDALTAASPALTGVPTAPTATAGTNTTQIATTAFVTAAVTAASTVATATKLATARTIALTGDVTYTSAAFDGSANVTGTATLAASGVVTGTYRSVTVDTKGRVTAGSNPTTLAGYGITGAVANYFRANKGAPNATDGSTNGYAFESDGDTGLFAVGGDNQNGSALSLYIDDVEQASLDYQGNFVARGNVTAYSDERLKTNWRPVADGFVGKLAAVKSGVYDRTDAEVAQVGVSAQSLREVVPEAVLEDDEGTLSVAYGNAALVAAVELAKVVEELKRELSEVKRELALVRRA